MSYVIGHKPDEFGLVPDREGYVRFKELLWALNEEPGWSYVRQGDINEVLMSDDRSSFEVKDRSIRCAGRNTGPDLNVPLLKLPAVLYTPVRRKAHASVIENGLPLSEDIPYVLSSDREMALRTGSRKDKKPVILEVMAEKAANEGVLFYSCGRLFLCMEIPSRYISGPPVPKEKIRSGEDKNIKKKKTGMTPATGTFVLESSRDPDKGRRSGGKKKKGWKEEAKTMRRRGRQ